MPWSLIVVLALLASPVAASTADDAQPAVSITISPFHLFEPILQVTTELRLADRIGAAAILGAGRITEDGRRHGTWEVGGQCRWYPFGSFTRGMMLGAEVGYLEAAGRLLQPMAYLGGVRVGAFLGYKIVMSGGFTFDVQLGDQYVMPSAGESEWQPLMNLKVGRSF